MTPNSIPVARPKLPDADALLPHLRAIDARRIYSNWGPLNAALEQQLGDRLGASVVTCSSATDGITCALRAVLEDRPAEKRFGLCLMPSWTFVATPHAALAAGLTPCFLDVEEGSWILTPDMVRRELLAGLKSNLPIAAVVVVAPFGLQLAPGPWDAFTAETGIPVVIDSAAAFDGLSVARTPSVVSLHATKTVCAGEGGFVATRDADLAKRIKRVANLGFLGTRLAEVPATNAKLSEYHAAVALCSLAAWPERRAEFLAVAQRLRAALEPGGVVFQPGFGESWVSSTCVLRLPDGIDSTHAAMALGLRGIATRSWWGFGCHTSPAFAHMPRRNHAAGSRLPATEILAQTTIGIPFYCDMSDAEIAQIGAAFAAITAAAPELATEIHAPLPGAFPALIPA
ncbi:MAG TPA: DegT/DnrJ/EryC1/StrS family aminotransferase [Roseomonas sp.]|jgi:dTDP-4-amino-4,6-dideoxygalactose transaminase